MNPREHNQAKLNEQAVALFYAGQIKEAEAICNKILRNTPQQSDTLNVLSAIRAAQGNFEEAIKLTNRALAYAPNGLDGYVNRSNYLQQLGRYQEAIESCKQALALRADFIPALLSKGGAYLAANELVLAFETFQQVKKRQPDLPVLAFRMGDVYFHMDHYEQALVHYDKALTLMPGNVEVMQNRALTLKRMQRFEEALAICNEALALAPNRAALLHLRGSVWQNLERFEEALADYTKAIALVPQHFDSHNDKGSALQKLGLFEEALANCQQAVALNPASAEAWNNYANCLLSLDQTAEALDAYGKALHLVPNLHTAYNNYSNALFKLGRYDEALKGYAEAIKLTPQSAAAYNGKGTVLHALGRYLEAGIEFNEALQVEPDSALAQFNKAIYRLLFGNFEEGWKLYEARWHKPGPRLTRGFTQPLWLGKQEIQGKTILLHGEQGLGDSIQFARYVPMVEALGARVVLEVQPALASLMQSLPGARPVLAKGETLPVFDLHCPLMSLPLAFGTRLETIPQNVPYLAASTAAEWQERLGPKKRLRIGLAWSGSKKHNHDALRSLPLETLAPLLALDAEFHVLQNEVRAGDKAFLAANPQLQFHGEALRDMNDAAGLMMAMDLVISVDTSLAHLAGALGKKTWILLPFAPDFRWLLERPDSPWYPSAELLRQTKLGEWQPVIEQLVTKAAALLPTPIDS